MKVTIGLETLLGLNDLPAHLDEHGPITADLARALAFQGDSVWRRLITDQITGQLLNYGRRTYAAPAPLRDFVRARDVTCRTPGCENPAERCDLDHLVAYPAGTTCEANLCAACRRHHRLKHEGRWHHRLSDDPNHPPGTIVIISPTGHVYLSHAPAVGPTIDDTLRAADTNYSDRASAPTLVPGSDPGPPPF